MRQTLLICLILLAVTGCRSTYYSVWEKMGWAKRDILVDRVEEARDDQAAAKKQFQTTLERFQQLSGVEGGALQTRYDKLKAEFDRSEAKAGDVTERINSVEQVATDLFKEWEAELAQYESAELRRSSEAQLRQTRERYQQLMSAMRRAEQKMQPVLAAFRDQVLFLKHNLNAQSVASLTTTVGNIETDVNSLIREMEAAISEANAFMDQMK